MPRTVLRRQARKMVYDVYCYMENEVTTEKDAVKRTSDATKTSQRTVRRIVKEGKESEFIPVFKTPGKKRTRKKPITELDILDQSVIRTCVHNYHITNNELPTAEKLRKKLKDDIDFNGSERSLRRILNNLGFRWKKIDYCRKILVEKTNIRLHRIEYLTKLMKYRKEGRPIVYTDESYMDSSHLGSKLLADGLSKRFKISKGERIVTVHAGSAAGFIPNALLFFKAGAKSNNDFHNNMSYENYTKWLRNQLIPNLPPNAVLVIDDAFYHNKQNNPAPTSNAKKADMKMWLAEKGIEYEDTMLKPQLYKLIKLNKDQHKTYSIDDILAEHNHSVLRLPPCHRDLNPLEMAWETIKAYVASKNEMWNVTNVIELVKQRVKLMGADEWYKLYEKVKKVEADYMKSDYVIDEATDKFLIYGEDSDSESESDESNVEDEEPTPSTSSTFMLGAWATHLQNSSDDSMMSD